MFRNNSHSIAAVALISLALIVSGCSEDTPAEVSLDDLTAQFKIQMGANEGDGGAAAGAAGFRVPNVFEQEPSESQMRVLGPVVNVLNWPIIQDTAIRAQWVGGDIGDEIRTFWSAADFPRNVWPELDVAGGERFGNLWVVYPSNRNDTIYWAQHLEWLRRAASEDTGTTVPFDEKLEANGPCLQCPIGLFIAGPSRHVTDQPEYRRRTAIKWFEYGTLLPWVWPDGGGGGGGGDPEPEPEPEPELQEVHVFVQKFVVQTDNGTVVQFDGVNRDIDLMTLRGQAIDVVDGEVPRGTFNDVEFFIDTTQSYVVVDGEQALLNFATGTVTVEGPIIVGDTPITTVRLVFDVEDSLTMNSDGSWTMAPVVVIEVTTG